MGAENGTAAIRQDGTSLPAEGRKPAAGFGTYLGQGDGTVSGPALSGSVFWDLFEIQGSRACDANIVGSITTDDAAVVGFEILGFFRNDDHGSNIWTLASAIRFRTDDSRYAGLDDLVGLVSGRFDMQAYVHHYDVLVPDAAPPTEG